MSGLQANAASYELAFTEAGRALDGQEFSASATDLIATYIEAAAPAPLSVIHRDLALHRSASYDRNAAQLRALVRAFRIGLACLVIEVAAWLVALGERV